MATATSGLPGIVIKGKVGNAVFVPLPDGRMRVRTLPDYLPPRTDLQREAEARMKTVARAWQGLSVAEGEAWARAAASPHPCPSPKGGVAPMRAYNLFLGLSAKRLQVFPDEPLPCLPPVGAFLGDGIVVEASGSPSPDGSFGRGGRGEGREEASGPLPQPPLQDEPLGEGAFVRFSASAPNSPGVLTELMLQRLKGVHRKPVLKEYRTAAFLAFEAGALEVGLPVEAGAWACAIRFVRASSGQETAVVPIGKVVVLPE